MRMAGQCAPHFLFGLAEKKTGRARSKRKERFWPQLCTGVQSCCTGVGVRWCLRVCEDWPTGAAGCGADLAADSRGVVRLGLEDTGAFEPLLFSCLALRRSQYLRHQCSAGFPPSARSACPHRARRNRKAAQPSTDAQSLRAPLAVVGAALFGREITGRFRISPSCALTGIRSLIVLLL